MMLLIIIAIFILVTSAIVGPIIYIQSRRNSREQKSYERGLKMVPLLIHLPPPSDDTELNGRDIRDLVDENISKAQIIYNIIASTYQKGWRNKLYGQKHISFEIVGVQGFVHFYVAVPVTLVDVVKQAVVSAYPAARLEEVSDYNVFSPIGKLSGTVGGELELKESFAYPIATYQDLKRDAMQALLNALSTLGRDDGAGIQIMLRPAESSWRKEAQVHASKKRKGKETSSGAEKTFGFLRLFLTAFVKAPESKENQEKDHKSNLSALDQSIIESIEDKTRYPGFDVVIRIVASSNISQRSQAILGNVVASFALFDAPGKNGFKYLPAKDVDRVVSDYVLRIFPQHKKHNILNSVELATLFHFPEQRSIPTSQLERQESKQVDGPRNMVEEGLLLGYNIFRGTKKKIYLSPQDRQRHMYAVGQTGTGKSTFLENLALQDMLNGNGFAFVDPHGDTAEKLLSMVPKERTEDVIYFCPADMDYPMGLNLFEYDDPEQKDFLIQEALNMLYKLYDPQHQGIMGPRYEHLFRNAALTVMADPSGGTFIDIPKLFRDPNYVKQKLQHVTDQSVIEFWQKEMPQSQRSNEFGEVVSWFVSKFGAFLSNAMMRNIIGQTKSSFKLRDVMDNGKILLVNLSKGRTGQLNMQLLGMIFVMKFQAAAMSRADIRDESQRRDFALYVDEFQNFSTDSFATIMSEARKYHLNLIVANQFTTQLSDEIRDAVFGNVGTTVAFRVGDRDAESLHKYFRPTFEETDLIRLPNYNSIVRTMIRGVPTQPFSMATLPPLGTPNPKLGEALKQLSAAKYGHPKAAVEAEIFSRMETKPTTPPVAPSSRLATAIPNNKPWSSSPGLQSPTNSNAGSMSTQLPKSSPGSFLDDWLVKRKSPSSNKITNPSALSQNQSGSDSAAANPSHGGPTIDSTRPPGSEFEKREVDTIAKKIKQDIAHPNTVTSIDRPTSPVSQPSQPISPSSNTPDISKKNVGSDGHLAPGDTIYIDQEGNLHSRDDPS